MFFSTKSKTQKYVCIYHERSYKKLMFTYINFFLPFHTVRCFWTLVLEKTLESPLDWEEIQPVHPKGNQSWIFIGRNDAEAETPILWPPDEKKRPLCWKRLKAGGKGDNRGWDGLVASLTQWTWVWVNSRSWWWTGRPGVLQSMGSQMLDVTEWLNWTEFNVYIMCSLTTVQHNYKTTIKV